MRRCPADRGRRPAGRCRALGRDRDCRFLSLPGLAMPPTRGWRTPPRACRQLQASQTGLRVFSADARLDLTPFALARACTFCIQLPAGAAKVGVRLERTGGCVTLTRESDVG